MQTWLPVSGGGPWEKELALWPRVQQSVEQTKSKEMQREIQEIRKKMEEYWGKAIGARKILKDANIKAELILKTQKKLGKQLGREAMLKLINGINEKGAEFFLEKIEKDPKILIKYAIAREITIRPMPLSGEEAKQIIDRMANHIKIADILDNERQFKYWFRRIAEEVKRHGDQKDEKNLQENKDSSKEHKWF